MTDVPLEPAEDVKALADRTTAWLRTVFPVAWSAVVAWLVTMIPALDQFSLGLNSFGAVILLAVVTGAVYPILRAIEAKKWIPNWVVIAMLGSAKRPTYLPAAVADKVEAGTADVVVEKTTPSDALGLILEPEPQTYPPED